MKTRLPTAVAAGLTLVTGSVAADWDFAAPLDVTGAPREGVFHHLDAAGRRGIAVGDADVALTWEDDNDGTPRVYLARKPKGADAFGAAVRISGDGEAFEPAVATLGDGRFVLAWEEDLRLYARIAGPDGLGPMLSLGDSEAVQAGLAVQGERIQLVGAERAGRYSRIRLHRLRADGLTLITEQACAVDPSPLQDDQLYPVPAWFGDELVVAWEDRRPGHTIIMAAASTRAEPCRFTPPRRLSEAPRDGRKAPYGKGHGVARVALGGSPLYAAWADKRNFREGYDIYGAPYLGGGRFGANQRVQDAFGELARQWHAAVAGAAGGPTIVAWTDEREGNSDILFSRYRNGAWSDDMPLPGAAGPGEQSHPAIALDAAGNLHAAWVERAQRNGPTQIRYVFGRDTE